MLTERLLLLMEAMAAAAAVDDVSPSAIGTIADVAAEACFSFFFLARFFDGMLDLFSIIGLPRF